MWETKFSSTINRSVDNVWRVLITPGLWKDIDPTHYRKVEYPKPTLEVGTKGKMAAESSQTFSFFVAKVDSKTHQTITESSIPFGKLRITKTLTPSGRMVEFEEKVVATGPFAKLLSKLFFKKQIEATIQSKHKTIKKYV